MAKQWVWIAVGAVAVGAVAAQCGDTPESGQAPTSSASSRTPSPSAPAPAAKSTTPKPWYVDYDPAQFAVQVRKYAGQAGIRPQLLMAILYNESYKPHDPELERSWAQIDSDPAFGIANMHRPAFDDTKRGRAFAKRKWEELPDDPALAIQAAAWHLHDLARRLPSTLTGQLTKDELLALGYNAGGGNMRKFARGVKPGPQAQSYLDRLRSNWDKSGEAVGT
ncbi:MULTISPECIES: transglycosylase SLT domain-containing protein [unclassified Kribbella]|uniref:transglycosylase SLT domain-containing protein n=1 Tax=unclassified Kribbella TaxID=2644121 RepID=UPI0034088450